MEIGDAKGRLRVEPLEDPVPLEDAQARPAENEEREDAPAPEPVAA